jgi:hypothetical protein
MLRELMKQKAAPKKDPEFYAAQEELTHKLTWATKMLEAERLTKAEFKEFEAHLTAEYLAALPVSAFIEMQKDGSYSDLEAIAGHDGTRDRHDVLKDRAALNKRITQDALDEAFAAQKIDSKRYSEEHRKLGTLDDKMSERVTDAADDGDHDAPAGEIFFSRNLPPGDLELAPATAPEGAPKDANED